MRPILLAAILTVTAVPAFGQVRRPASVTSSPGEGIGQPDALFWLAAQGPSADSSLREVFRRASNPQTKEDVLFYLAARGERHWLARVARDPSESVRVRQAALFWLNRELGLLGEIAGAAESVATPDVRGVWTGGLDTRLGFWLLVNLRLGTEQDSLSGVIDHPMARSFGLPLTTLRTRGDSVWLQWRGQRGPAHVRGRITGDTLTGEFQQENRAGAFRAIRGARFDLDRFRTFAGVYRLPDDDLVWVGDLHEIGGKPAYVQLSTGRAGVLYPVNDTSFLAGSDTYDPTSPDLQITFVRDRAGKVEALRWNRGSESVTARQVDTYLGRTVTFRNGNVNLTGTLYLPTGPGPHPGVVLIHGAGQQDRTYFGALPRLLAARGVAALTYDKRGVGESSGDWTQSTFNDLARDALAGLQLLQGQSGVDARHVGLFGHSQGGWLAPLAATMSPDVAFVVTAAGPANSPEDQDKDRIEFQMRADGFSEDAIRDALEYNRLRFDVLHGRADFTKYEAARATTEGAAWASYVARPATPDQVQVWRIYQYDSEAVLRRLSTPILSLFGGRDRVVPPERNASLMSRLLAGAGNSDATVRIIPGVGHDFMDAVTGGRMDSLQRAGFGPTYLPTVIDWIREQGVKGR